jgi:hypothetical protein
MTDISKFGQAMQILDAEWHALQNQIDAYDEQIRIATLMRELAKSKQEAVSKASAEILAKGTPVPLTY